MKTLSFPRQGDHKVAVKLNLKIFTGHQLFKININNKNAYIKFG